MKIFTLVIVAAAGLLLSSCSKCVKCTKASDSQSICENNYSSTTVYEAEVNSLKANGYTCVSE